MTTIPRPEHPRPQFQREQWLNLNGQWRFTFDEHAIGEQMRWFLPKTAYPKQLTITVPFPWESPLSGVTRPDYKGAAWYEREFTVPADWTGLTPYLNFGAVDWHARVWINGRYAAEHANGYLPFSVDLSDHVEPGETAVVTVRAYDIADATTLVGKQVPRWYTHSSGIWQTVWLEGRAPSHITALRIEPDVTQAQATAKVSLHIAQAGAYVVRIRANDDAFQTVEVHESLPAGEHQITLILQIPAAQLWSPETPHLYEVSAELAATDSSLTDRVASYFGMRSIGRGVWQENDYQTILLNGEPVYLRGALDQAFHPDSLHAYPSDDVIRGDIQLAKDLGLNMLRCHIKINDPRYYYWADRLGLLMMYDFPSPDLDTPTMRRIFAETLPLAIERDFNSPSIFAWILFNETWGLTHHTGEDSCRWLHKIVQEARALDPSRLIEDNSVCRYDHVDSDINSWHYYINDYARTRQHVQRVVDETYLGSTFNYVGGEFVQSTAPLMNSEYGGIGARMGDQDIAWCFKYHTTELRRHAKICGYVYTELDDIEWEHNGLVNYDRSPKEFGYDSFVPGMTVADLNSADLVGLDAPPCQTLRPGATFSAPLFVSHWGTPMVSATVRWQFDFTNRFGGRQTVTQGSFVVQPQRFGVIDAGTLRLTLPIENGLATVALWLEDEQGVVRCRNYVNVEVHGEPAPHVEKLAEGWAVRFAPGIFTQTSATWPLPFAAADGSKFSAQGSGWVEYEVNLPTEIDLPAVRRLRLLFEASARAGTARIDWPQQVSGLNYPQTDVNQKTPSDLVISLNGATIGAVRLPDDPADARGVLSHHHHLDPGSYGYLTEIEVDSDQIQPILAGQPTVRIRFTIPENAEYHYGFALYGETLGGYPVGPTVILE